MFVFLQRVIKFGWINFKRNSGISLANVFIMVLTISLITSIFLFQQATQFLVKTLQEKVDMHVYFNQELSSEEILELRDQLSKLTEIKKMEYISQEEALQRFIQRHQNEKDLMESLEELGRNPLLNSLNIRTWDTAQYASIVNFLGTSSFKDFIAKIDYQEKKPTIERLFSIASTINKMGIIFSLVFALLAFWIVYNTVRLSIYGSKEEIETMRLVGASNWFIRGPFLAQGAMIGLLAFFATFLVCLVSLFFLAPSLEFLLPGFNMFNYFVNNLLIIVLIQLVTGVGLGIASSWLAVRKYLRV